MSFAILQSSCVYITSISSKVAHPYLMTMTDTDDAAIKRMADLLRRGATMLAEACPICGAPLLRVDEDIYCASCDKRFITQQETKATRTTPVKTSLPRLRTAIVSKLEHLGARVNDLTNLDELEKTIKIIIQFLKALEMIDSYSNGK